MNTIVQKIGTREELSAQLQAKREKYQNRMVEVERVSAVNDVSQLINYYLSKLQFFHNRELFSCFFSDIWRELRNVAWFSSE